ncbi:Rho guanine nucleotide exchange factor 26 [Orchesella cincta]|uniref:Rho guanine nucleotide exchange factor 26 n=1 Tax=Orchesella cincta TaxID=48709 RepID=A0A1D2NLY5_ORCCI|nr:Rho guanine nucleotide exchange factor 26 [Orchesella cincta]
MKNDNEIFNKPLPLPPSNASTYESVYEEPIYGITNKLTATYSDNGRSGGASPGKRRSSAPAAPFLPLKLNSSKPGSTYSHSPSVSSGSTYGYSSGSINEYGESGSPSKYGPSSCQTVVSSSSTTGAASPAADGMSIYGISDKLPPTPPSKFSSIAKTAGRKIAKKFLGMRKTSKSSLDDPQPSSFDSSNVSNSPLHLSQLQESKETSVTNSNNEKIGGNCSGTQIRRPISRPSIPPPEPPKNEYGSPPTSIGTTNNYSIYDKNERGSNEDDFDDSDFYDSDSELIRNFVSQVQPIYSMEEEPLYQYYTYGISLKPDDDYQPVIPKNLGLTLDMLVPRVGQRTLWCELPGVVSSGILSILSDKQKQLQEAIFEILTSEVSYLKSLDVLISLFYKNEELIGVMTEEERGYLFGKIEDVRDCSQGFLSELLAKWEESWYIQEIGDIIIRNTETRFSVYKEYCRNKPYQDKTMQKLRHTRDEFVSVVKAIEEDGRCQMLQVDSFLMLPMQRITRLPLLVNAVIQRTAAGKEKNKCEEALKCLTNLVLSCNDAARESQDAEETMAILEKLEFTRGIRSLPDLGQFIMKGDFMKNPFDQSRGNQINWTFRKAKRQFYWLLLFSKQLLVARRKANGRFEIIDMTDPLDSHIKMLPNLEGVSKDFKHFFMLHFNRKETVYFLSARTNSEVERWKSKLDGMKPKEELRVEAIFPYDARRPDEMSFYVGDVIRVSQMQPDGWYFGTKLKSGESGWFPGNYCCENAT